MRRLPTLLACLVIAAPILTPPPCADAQSRRLVDPRQQTAEQMLKPITVNFQDARLQDVMKFLADFTGASFDVAWLDDHHADGLDPEKTVSISVQDVTTLSLLERLLKKSYDGFDGATWQFTRDGQVEIGPKGRLNASATLKIYDIHDLLFTVQSFTDIPNLGLGQITQGQGGGSNSGNFQGEDTQRGTDEEEAQKIIDILVRFIEPDQWRDNGGDGASVSFYNGALLIRAPDYIQRQIGGYSFWPTNSSRQSPQLSKRNAPVKMKKAQTPPAQPKDAKKQDPPKKN